MTSDTHMERGILQETAPKNRDDCAGLSVCHIPILHGIDYVFA